MPVAFVARETEADETRVAMTPSAVKQFLKFGFVVKFEAGAGRAAGFPDQEYQDAGAEKIDSAAEGFAEADLVAKIRPPRDGGTAVASMKAGAILVCGMQPLLRLPLVQSLAQAGVTTFAMDLVPRITRAQKMDILSSQATTAGYMAVLLAATHLPKMFPMMMTAAGTIRPAKVLILGAGVAGLQAIATARRLGAVVEANDIRPAVKEQVESLGAKFVDTGTPPQAETSGGYAKETSEEYARKQREILTKHLAAADAVITTALIPGRKAPVLISGEMLAAMPAGSVAVDLAVEMGGNIEGSVAGETVTKHGVTIIGEPNLPALVAKDASQMFARNIADFVEPLVKEGKIEPDWEDEIVSATVVTHGGEIRHAASVEALSGKGAS